MILSKTFRSLKSHHHHIETPKPQNQSLITKPRSSVSPPSSWSVYLILSTNAPLKTYVGVTTNFSRRLKQHNGELKGGAKASRAGRPWICACIIRGFNDHSEGINLECFYITQIQPLNQIVINKIQLNLCLGSKDRFSF
ncbi:hypothetical protein MKX01_009449 [Papaver californicum]|nr:hypothetical protein MKX01_009449 [Papaver californicum]